MTNKTDIPRKNKKKRETAKPLKGKGFKRKKDFYLRPRGSKTKPKARIPRLGRLPRYGCQLGRIRLDFGRTGRKYMSPTRFAQLLGMGIERYLNLERGTYKRELTATELLLLLNKVNTIRRSFGLPKITAGDLWKVE